MKRTTAIGLGALAVAAVAGAWAYTMWFAPESSTVANEPLPELRDGSQPSPDAGREPVPLRSGTFHGADDFHFARGTVDLHQAENGSFILRFEGYDAREGPDVYLYLTRNAGDDSASEVEGQGVRLRVPGGEGDGRATVRGSFNVFVPVGLDPLAYGGVAIWCDDFNHFFGHAALGAP